MNSGVILAFVASLCAGGLATAAAFRARRSASRWAFVAGMAVLAAESGFAGASMFATDPRDVEFWQSLRLIAAAAGIGAWCLFGLTYARGGASQPKRLGLVIVVGSPIAFALWGLREHLILSVRPAEGPDWILRLGWLGYAVNIAALAAAVFVLVNLERTFRAAVGTVRWRIKFMLLGVAALFVTRIYTSSEILLFRGLDLRLESVNCGALIVATPLIVWSLYRSGHLDLDVYPSGSTLANSVTVLLAGIYLFTVGILAKAVAWLGGDAAFGVKALAVLIALVALAIVAQSDRLRARVRRFVSRNFQRPLYDYRSVWNKFTAATTSRVEPGELNRSLVAFVADSFQALSVRLWVANEANGRLVVAAATDHPASTALPETASAELAAHFAAAPDPVDFETLPQACWSALRHEHPTEFVNGGRRVCVPLLARGELLGLLTIGDRIDGAPFALQDYELLRCIGDQAAACLLNVQLAQRLSQAKQLEAFQTMATFFVHDLKNAASTLTLTLRNLPTHFDDPEFRADALRGIGRTAEHINRLIARLTALRHELTVEPKVDDINELVQQVLSTLGQAATPTIEQEIRPVPRVAFDREQMHKVITNLVLNATEAVGENGRVHVSTGEEKGWVVLTVDDNGCGMSEEFRAQSLFRPFRTTKKAGLGIGMFQSKMIVEAHGGRIAVASTRGSGTRFQIFLRAQAAGSATAETVRSH